MHILKQRLESLPGKQNNGLACMLRRPAGAAQRSVHNLSTRASLPMRSSVMLRFLDMRCGHCPFFKRMKRGAGLLRTNSRTMPPRNPQLRYKQFIAFMEKYPPIYHFIRFHVNFKSIRRIAQEKLHPLDRVEPWAICEILFAFYMFISVLSTNCSAKSATSEIGSFIPPEIHWFMTPLHPLAVKR